MASFTAELHVDGTVYSLTHCSFGVQQATHQRGRVCTKVRYEPIQLALDVPTGDELFAWANAPHKRLPVVILFRSTTGGSPLESLRMAAAYCVRYREAFAAGNVQDGAYRAFLTLSDPDGWTLTSGGPATAFITPDAREHGQPISTDASLAAQVAATALPSTGKTKLVPGTPEHKAARWAAYQAKNQNNVHAWSKERWNKQYETNLKNCLDGLAREAQYQQAMNAVSKTLKTPLTLRQIDLFKQDERYCGQLKTGKMSLNKQAKHHDIPKDAELVKQLFEVEYILEKGASKPFLTALEAAGVTYKLGPQIP